MFGGRKIKQVQNDIRKVQTGGLKIVHKKSFKQPKRYASTKRTKIK